MSVDVAPRCTALDACVRRQHPAMPARSSGTLVAVWVMAGSRAGFCLGATLGGLITLVGGLWPVVLVGVILGGLVGGIAGLAVGALNGVVLGALSKTLVLGPGEPDRRNRATFVAAATTGFAGVALQLALFGWLPGRGPRFFLVYLPAAASALTAAHLSRRLPPGS